MSAFGRGADKNSARTAWGFGAIRRPAQPVVAQFLTTFQEFPPRQKPASFSVDQALEAMQKASAGRD
jgi:hypothetical protein